MIYEANKQKFAFFRKYENKFYTFQKKKKKERSAMPTARRNLIFQSTLVHPPPSSSRCNEIIFSSRPSLRFFCAGFLLNAGHKIVGYGRAITQTRSTGSEYRMRKNEGEGNTRGRQRAEWEGIGEWNEFRPRIKVVQAQVPIPFFQFFQPRSAGSCTRARKKSAGYKSPRAHGRPFSKTLKVHLVAHREAAPIRGEPFLRLADDN